MATRIASFVVLLLHLSPHLLSGASAADVICAIGSGQKGVCLSTSYCKSSGGSSTKGYCKGQPADVQCCTYGGCATGGLSGLCIPTDSCSGKAHPENLCPGPVNIQCCTYGTCKLSSGKAGKCGRKSACDGVSTAGLCGGPSEIQCCTAKEQPSCTPEPSEVNGETIQHIIGFEDWRDKVYDDGSGNPTVGYGHKCSSWTCSEIGYPIPLSKANGEKLMQSDLFIARRCLTIDLANTVILNPNQYGALVSWTYNVGCGHQRDSTLTARLNRGEDPDKVAREELPKWVYDNNNKKLQGLVNRRNKEVALFVKPASGIAHPPSCSGFGSA